jgi:hypothetical protein
MGLDRAVTFPEQSVPSWEAIRAALERVGESVKVMMIDGMPAFPDEVPEASWKELRLGTSAGMVTLRRGVGTIRCVIWGNSDAKLHLIWSKVIWACATATGGQIETEQGRLDPAEFAKNQGFLPSESHPPA